MRRPMVAGNWKMHGSRSANGALLAELEQRLMPESQVDVVVFPPYVYLAEAVRMLDESDIAGCAGCVRGTSGCIHGSGRGLDAQGRGLPLRDRGSLRAASFVS